MYLNFKTAFSMNDSVIYQVCALGWECSSVVECSPNVYKALRAPSLALGGKKDSFVIFSNISMFPCKFPGSVVVAGEVAS